jgi:hypothetical protein
MHTLSNGDPVVGNDDGVGRRSFLKRGAVLGAAAAWTVPIVQFVATDPAHAETPSAPAGGAPAGHGGAAANGGTVSDQGAGGTAFTGTSFPVGPTVAIGTAAVVLGAGAVAAAQIRGHRSGPDNASDQSDGTIAPA